MKQLTCEMCGSTDLVKQDGFFVCQTCGTKYSVEEAKKMMIEGTVEVQGTVKVDDTSKVENYYVMAENAYSAGNKYEAETYCNKIIEIDSGNYKAWYLKGKAASWQSTLGKLRIEEAMQCFARSLQFVPSDKDDIRDQLKQEASIEFSELAKALLQICFDSFEENPSENNRNDIVANINRLNKYKCLMIDELELETDFSKLFNDLSSKLFIVAKTSYYNIVQNHLDDQNRVRHSKERSEEAMRCIDMAEIAINIYKVDKIKECGIAEIDTSIKDINKSVAELLAAMYEAIIEIYKNFNDVFWANISGIKKEENVEKIRSYSEKRRLIDPEFKRLEYNKVIQRISEAVLAEELDQIKDELLAFGADYERVGQYLLDFSTEKANLLQISFTANHIFNLIVVNPVKEMMAIKRVWEKYYPPMVQHIPFDSVRSISIKGKNLSIQYGDNNVSTIVISGYEAEICEFCKKILPMIKKVNPNVTEAKSGCYVATCVYGSYDCPQVWTLRRYRDDVLGSTWYGRAFIRTYYAISPTLVKWFGKTKWFKKMWKGKLDRMVNKLQEEGVENTPYEDKDWSK